MKKIVQIFCVLMPWFLKRRLLQVFFGYKIHPTAYIGLSWIFPRDLIMEAHSKIGHLNVAVHLDSIQLKEYSSVGGSNGITGFASGTSSKHFQHQPQRCSQLLLGRHSAITKKHHLDCTNSLTIGEFTTIAGYQSQFLTHSIDVFANRQDSKPIVIGNYCFVSTNVTVLGGAILPDYSILGAKSLLNKNYNDSWILYAGVPARPVKSLPEEALYFKRKTGFVL